MSIKLVAIDMDDTLLRKNKTFDKELLSKVFHALNDREVKVLINSGNSVKKLHSYFGDDLRQFMYFGGDDGNYLVQQGKAIQVIGLSRDRVIDILHVYGDLEFAHAVISTGDEAYTKPFKNEADKKEVYKYYEELNFIDNFEDIPNRKIVKLEFLSRQSLEENKQMTADIEAEFSGTSSVTSGDDWLDIYHSDGGKGKSVNYLQEKYNISKEQTIAFGDSLNDASMMLEADYRCGVANADEELLDKYCNYKIPSSEEQGVLQILDAYLTAGNMDFMSEYKH